jgi:PAS domain S-box-containing protein
MKFQTLFYYMTGVISIALIVILTQSFFPLHEFHQIAFHSTIETIGAFAALNLFTLLLLKAPKSDRSYYILAQCSLIAMGLLDLFHSLVSPGENFVWLHSTATFAGGMLFSLVWLPEKILKSKTMKTLPAVVFIMAISIGLLALLLPKTVPPMLVRGQFTNTAKGLNFLGGGLFLVASSWFIMQFRQHRRRFEEVLFAIFCLLFGIAGIIFTLSQLWDTDWWLWHIIRLLSYALALFYVFETFRRSEATLQMSEERYRSLVENSPDLIYVFSNKRGGLYYSQRAKDILGYSSEELCDKSFIWHDSIHPEDLPAVNAAIKGFYHGSAYEIEYRIRDRAGNWHWFLDRFIRTTRDRDEIIIEGLASDITSRKRAEKDFVNEQNRAQMYLNVAGVMIGVLDAQGIILLMNMKGCALLGYGTAEILGNNWFDLCLPERMRQEVKGVFESLMAGKIEPVEYYENPVLRKGGEERIIAFYNNVIRNEKGEICGILFSGEDVTDRRRIEKDLQIREERLREAIRVAVIGIFDHNHLTNTTYWSPEMYAMHDCDQDAPPPIPEVVNRIYPEDRERVARSFRRALDPTGDGRYDLENRFLRRNGTVRTMVTRSQTFFEGEGKSQHPVRTVGAVRDITDERRIDDEVHLQADIINRMSEGVYLLRMADGIIVWANPKFEQMFGYANGELLGKHASIVNYPSKKNPEETAREILDILAKNGVWQGEIQNIKKDGTPFWCFASVVAFNHSTYGKVLVAVHNDITAQKRGENDQNRLRQRLEAQWEMVQKVGTDQQTLCDQTLAFLTLLSESHYGFYGFLNENETVMRIHAWSKEVMCDCKIHNKPIDYPIEKAGVWGNVIRERKILIINDMTEEHPLKKGLPEGHVVIHRIMVIPVFSNDRIVAVGVVANKAGDYTAQDSMEMHEFLHSAQLLIDNNKSEEALQHSENFLNEVGLIAKIGGWEMDLITHKAKWTKGTYDIVEIDEDQPIPGPDEHLDYYLPEFRPMIQEAMRALIEENIPLDFEAKLRTAKGNIKWCRALAQAIRKDGVCVGLYGTFQDITAQKRNEFKLHEYADTQAVLLREVNHRVKNNLSLIVGMLHKEEDIAKGRGQTAALPLLYDLEGRIKALLTAHKMFSATNWQPLLLSRLCEQIISGSLDSSASDIKVNITASELQVDSNQAHHLSMVLNELTTNSFKYAISEPAQTSIDIDIQEEADKIFMTFRDNGPGYPEYIISGEYAKPSIGFNLINGIVKKSLGGTISFKNEKGAVAEIRFNKAKITERDD